MRAVGCVALEVAHTGFHSPLGKNWRIWVGMLLDFFIYFFFFLPNWKIGECG
jgi:hypothetical protein